MTIILSHKRNSTHDYLDFKYITLCIRYCIETVHVTNITQGIFCYPSYNLVVSNLYNYQLSGINLLFNFQPSCIACVYVSTKQIFLNLLCLLFLFFFLSYQRGFEKFFSSDESVLSCVKIWGLFKIQQQTEYFIYIYFTKRYKHTMSFYIPYPFWIHFSHHCAIFFIPSENNVLVVPFAPWTS